MLNVKKGIPLEKRNFYPFILTVVIVAMDQLSKALIVKYLPLGSSPVELLGRFLRFIHVRNTGAALSFGANWPPVTRIIVLVGLATVFLIFLGYLVVKGKDFTYFQRWMLGGVIGGGLGNVVIDRIFRAEGVVDFIDFQFFTFIFRSGRFPTFNIADSAITVCTALMFISILSQEIKNYKEKQQKK